MRRIFSVVAVLALAVFMAAGLAACKTTARPSPQNDTQMQKKEVDPRRHLSGTLFALKDERDMAFAMQRAQTMTGVSVESFRERARELTFADFERYLDQQAEAKRLVYKGNGVFRVDVLNYALEEDVFKEGSFYVRLFKFSVDGRAVEGSSLERIVLGGMDVTEYAAFRVYLGTLLSMTDFY